MVHCNILELLMIDKASTCNVLKIWALYPCANTTSVQTTFYLGRPYYLIVILRSISASLNYWVPVPILGLHASVVITSMFAMRPSALLKYTLVKT